MTETGLGGGRIVYDLVDVDAEAGFDSKMFTQGLRDGSGHDAKPGARVFL